MPASPLPADQTAYSRRAFMLLGGGLFLNSCASSNTGDDLAMDGPVFGQGQQAVTFKATSATGQFDLAQLKIVARTVAKGRDLNANEQRQVVNIARQVYEDLVEEEIASFLGEVEEGDGQLDGEGDMGSPMLGYVSSSSRKRKRPRRRRKTRTAEQRRQARRRLQAKKLKGIAVPIAKKEVAFASVKDEGVAAESSSYLVDNDLPDAGSSTVAFASVKEDATANIASNYSLESEGPQVAAVEHEGENYALATP